MSATQASSKVQIIVHETAGCFLVRKNIKDEALPSQVYLIYKKWSETNQGWVPPKGHLDPGETKEQAAIRETIEETGFQNIKLIDHLETVNIEYPSPTDPTTINQKTIHWFLAELQDNTMKDLIFVGSEQSSYVTAKWFNFTDALQALRFPDEKAILQKIINKFAKAH